MRRRQKNAPNDFVLIGQVVGVFGIKGCVKIAPTTQFPERFNVGETLYIAGVEHSITWTAWHKGQVRVGLKGISTPEDAALLINKPVEVPKEWRPELDKDEFYAGDLMGLKVLTLEGELVGKVTQVITGRAQDLLEVEGTLIPMVREFIKEISIKKGEVRVSLLPGMRAGEEPV